jgi:hypothetical protein
MTTDTNEAEEKIDKENSEMVRREFIKRFGAYTAGTAIGLYVLMSPKTARAIGSDGAP